MTASMLHLKSDVALHDQTKHLPRGLLRFQLGSSLDVDLLEVAQGVVLTSMLQRVLEKTLRIVVWAC